MDCIDFDVMRFIGKGCYSMVYEVTPKLQYEDDSIYAFKRIFIQDPNAVTCAKKERDILVRLAEESNTSPFLPTLYYSYILKRSPVLILRRGSGWDLYQVLTQRQLFSELDARFYASEIICGLEHIHSMQIVHLDLKPENILLDRSGHVIISDFDRSFDLSRKQKPKAVDFGGTLSFMAPEVAKQDVLSTKADVWSLAALIAEMVSGPIRPPCRNVEHARKMARENQFKIRNLNKLSKNLQALLKTCLLANPNARPDIVGVKGLRFFKFVDWNKVVRLEMTPPFVPDTAGPPASSNDWGVDPYDSRLLDAAFDEHMPLITTKLVIENGRCVPVRPDLQKLEKEKIDLNKLEEHLGDFNFVHSTLRRVVVEANPIEVVESDEIKEVDDDLTSKSFDTTQMRDELERVRERHFSRD